MAYNYKSNLQITVVEYFVHKREKDGERERDQSVSFVGNKRAFLGALLFFSRPLKTHTPSGNEKQTCYYQCAKEREKERGRERREKKLQKKTKDKHSRYRYLHRIERKIPNQQINI